MRFHPRRWPGALLGAGLIVLLLALDTCLALSIAHRTPDLVSFGLGMVGLMTLPLLAALGFGLYGLLTLTYDVNRNRVLIRWAILEQVIPMGRVKAVVPGDELPGSVRWRGISCPGYEFGSGEVEGWGSFVSYATEPLARQLLLVTPSLAYAVSPRDPERFLSALQVRHRMGTLQSMPQAVTYAPFTKWDLWRDRILWALILAGGLANTGLFAYLCSRYARLPLVLPLHFDPLGVADRVGSRSELFRLPLIGLLVLLANGVLSVLLHPRYRLARQLLLAGAIVVQALLGAALHSLTG